MELNLNGIKDVSAWSTYKLPSYDLQAMQKETFANPAWLHFGSGNIFRAFIAAAAQRMLNAGITDTGIICDQYITGIQYIIGIKL